MPILFFSLYRVIDVFVRGCLNYQSLLQRESEKKNPAPQQPQHVSFALVLFSFGKAFMSPSNVLFAHGVHRDAERHI